MLKIIIIILLIILSAINICYSSSTPSTYSNVVKTSNDSLQVQYYNINNSSLITQFTISNVSGRPIGIVSGDNFGVEYISYNNQDGFCLNYYDIESNTTKLISNISYTYNTIDYDYQPIISSRPSNTQSNIYTIVGFGNMGWLSYNILNFNNGLCNQTRANIYQSHYHGNYVSGYDYYSNNYYVSYLSTSTCVQLDIMNATSLEWDIHTSRFCSSLTYSPYDKVMPIMFNNTRYIITSFYDSREIILKRIDTINNVLVGTDIFKFINLPNDPNSFYAPYFFISLQDEYLSISTYNYLNQTQINIINLNNLSTTSTLITPTSNVYSIFTF